VGQARRIENAKILIANTAMDADKVKIYGAKVKTNDITNVVQLEQAGLFSMFYLLINLS
jgi:T-complex protein 1 subunit beta